MFFISLNILKALIVSIDMEIQSKNLNLRLDDRLEKKSYTVSNSIYCDRFSRSLMSFAVAQLNGCVLHFCITVLQKKTLRSTYHKQKSSLFDANRATETRTGDIGKLSLEL